MNNWIDTTPSPKPSNAAIVNAYDALLAAAAMQKERGQLPTWSRSTSTDGRPLPLARTLNGVPSAGQ